MKKITLSLFAIAATFAVNAQDFAATSNTVPTGNFELGPLELLWEQPTSGTSGIVNDFNVDEDFGVWSTDDFELTADKSISKVTAFGFQNNGDLIDNLVSVSVFIYENLDGLNIPDSDPTIAGSAFYELEVPNGDPALEVTQVDGFEFVVDIALANGGPVNIPAGNYWMVITPSLANLVGMDGPSRWNQFDAGVPAAGITEAHLIDPTDVFAGGFTAWTPFSGLGLTFGSVAFTVEGGDPVLGVDGFSLDSQISIFPNPASNIINIRSANDVTVDSVVMFDVLGKTINVNYTNGQVDISTLSRGVYIVNVNTNRGTLTQKVIKQ